jgi:uncharacterized protein DUF3617
MRALIIVPLCLAAACSGGAEEAKVEEAAATLAAGEWEIEAEVTRYDARGTGKALKAAKGDKSSSRACIDEAGRAEPPSALFAGEGAQCRYENSYIKNGRINAALRCTRAGLGNDLMVNIEGSFDADSFEGTTRATSNLGPEGSLALDRKIRGRRVGDCPPAKAV